MKKLSLLVLAVFASISIFANVDEVVKPDKGKEVVNKLNEYLKQKDVSRKNLGHWDEKKPVYNEISFLLTYYESCYEETQFDCDVESYYYTEIKRTWEMEVLRYERDDDGQIISITSVAKWSEEESYTIGECPGIE